LLRPLVESTKASGGDGILPDGPGMVVERTRGFSIVVIMTTYESDEKWYGEMSPGIENVLEQDEALDECVLQKRCRELRDES
jgi:hypothetical protein